MMTMKSLILAVIAGVMLLVPADLCAQKSYTVAKRTKNGTAIIKYEPGLVPRLLAMPRHAVDTAVAMTEPDNSGFGKRKLSQKDMTKGKTSYTLLDRSRNLAVNSVKTVSEAGGIVVNTGIKTGKKAIRFVSPY